MSFGKIISGGQTGVDRAALDVALEKGLPCGGWCPRGRRAEDGSIAERYPLEETPLDDYRQRTEWNVRDSDGTLILCWQKPTGGTAFTIEHARTYRRPYLIVDLTDPVQASVVADWVRDNAIRVLNIAGPRESHCPGKIYVSAKGYLEKLISKIFV